MSSYQQFTKYPSRTIKTIIIGLIYFGTGSFSVILRPALLDLQIFAGTTIEKIGILLSVKSFGYLLGSIFVGLLGEKINHQIMLMAFLLILILTTFLFSFFPSILIMNIFMALIGLASGFIETMSNVFVIHLWGKNSAPFLQLVQVLYAFGSSVGPIIIKPFLTKYPNAEMQNRLSTIETVSFNLLNENSSLKISEFQYNNFTTSEIRSDYSKIKWPFIINSIYYLFVFFAFSLVYFLCPDKTCHLSRSENNEINEAERNDRFQLKIPIKGSIKKLVVIISILAIHSFYALEILFGSFLALFTVLSDLQTTTLKGSNLVFSFWTAYTLFRILSFIGIIYFSPRSISLFNCLMIMLSNLILIKFGNTFAWAILIGLALMSFGFSSMWAIFFTLSEQISRLTTRMISVFMVSATLAKILIPVIIGYYIDKKPKIFLLTVIVYSFISFISILTLISVQYHLLKKQEKMEKKKKTMKVNLNPKKKLLKKGQKLIKGPKLLMKII